MLKNQVSSVLPFIKADILDQAQDKAVLFSNYSYLLENAPTLTIINQESSFFLSDGTQVFYFGYIPYKVNGLEITPKNYAQIIEYVLNHITPAEVVSVVTSKVKKDQQLQEIADNDYQFYETIINDLKSYSEISFNNNRYHSSSALKVKFNKYYIEVSRRANGLHVLCNGTRSPRLLSADVKPAGLKDLLTEYIKLIQALHAEDLEELKRVDDLVNQQQSLLTDIINTLKTHDIICLTKSGTVYATNSKLFYSVGKGKSGKYYNAPLCIDTFIKDKNIIGYMEAPKDCAWDLYKTYTKKDFKSLSWIDTSIMHQQR